MIAIFYVLTGWVDFIIQNPLQVQYAWIRIAVKHKFSQFFIGQIMIFAKYTFEEVLEDDVPGQRR